MQGFDKIRKPTDLKSAHTTADSATDSTAGTTDTAANTSYASTESTNKLIGVKDRPHTLLRQHSVKRLREVQAVSYTHLTLPTILLV